MMDSEFVQPESPELPVAGACRVPPWWPLFLSLHALDELLLQPKGV